LLYSNLQPGALSHFSNRRRCLSFFHTGRPRSIGSAGAFREFTFPLGSYPNLAVGKVKHTLHPNQCWWGTCVNVLFAAVQNVRVPPNKGTKFVAFGHRTPGFATRRLCRRYMVGILRYSTIRIWRKAAALIIKPGISERLKVGP